MFVLVLLGEKGTILHLLRSHHSFCLFYFFIVKWLMRHILGHAVTGRVSQARPRPPPDTCRPPATPTYLREPGSGSNRNRRGENLSVTKCPDSNLRSTSTSRWETGSRGTHAGFTWWVDLLSPVRTSVDTRFPPCRHVGILPILEARVGGFTFLCFLLLLLHLLHLPHPTVVCWFVLVKLDFTCNVLSCEGCCVSALCSCVHQPQSSTAQGTEQYNSVQYTVQYNTRHIQYTQYITLHSTIHSSVQYTAHTIHAVQYITQYNTQFSTIHSVQYTQYNTHSTHKLLCVSYVMLELDNKTCNNLLFVSICIKKSLKPSNSGAKISL